MRGKKLCSAKRGCLNAFMRPAFHRARFRQARGADEMKRDIIKRNWNNPTTRSDHQDKQPMCVHQRCILAWFFFHLIPSSTSSTGAGEGSADDEEEKEEDGQGDEEKTGNSNKSLDNGASRWLVPGGNLHSPRSSSSTRCETSLELVELDRVVNEFSSCSVHWRRSKLDSHSAEFSPSLGSDQGGKKRNAAPTGPFQPDQVNSVKQTRHPLPVMVGKKSMPNSVKLGLDWL